MHAASPTLAALKPAVLPLREFSRAYLLQPRSSGKLAIPKTRTVAKGRRNRSLQTQLQANAEKRKSGCPRPVDESAQLFKVNAGLLVTIQGASKLAFPVHQIDRGGVVHGVSVTGCRHFL